MSTVLIAIGLAFAGFGSALLHQRRYALAAWAASDGRFPDHMQTEAEPAGMGLLSLGVAVVAFGLIA